MGGALREIIASFGFEVDEKALEVVESHLEGVTESLGKVAAAFGGAAIIHAVASFTREQIEAGLQSQMMSKRLGVSVDALETLGLAAEGVSFDAMTTGIRFLNKNLGNAAEDGGEAQKTFAALGITIKDAAGNIRPTVELFGDVAEKIAEMKSPAEQTAAAMKIFGRGGSELLPFLQEGREGLEHAKRAFVELGGGVSKGYLEKAKLGARATHEFEFAMTGLKSQISEALIPGFTYLQNAATRLVVGIRAIAKETTILRSIFPALATGGLLFAVSRFLSLQVAGSRVIGIFQALGSGARTLGLALKAAWTSGVLPAVIAYAVFDDLFALFDGKRSVIGDVLDAMFGKGMSADVVKEVVGAWKDFRDIFMQTHDAVKEANSEPPPTTFLEYAGNQLRAFVYDAGAALARAQQIYYSFRALMASGDEAKAFSDQARYAGELAGEYNIKKATVLGTVSEQTDAFEARRGIGAPGFEARQAAAQKASIADHPALSLGLPQAPFALPPPSVLAPAALGPGTGGAAAPAGSYLDSHDSYSITIDASGGDPKEVARRAKDAVIQGHREAAEKRAAMNAVRTQ